MTNRRILYYVKRFTEIYDGNPWFGDALVTKLKELGNDKALTKPYPQLHCIAEIVSHMTYWRRGLINKLESSPTPSPTMESKENWLSYEGLKQLGWDTVRTNFDTSQQEIITMLSTKEDSFLSEFYSDKITVKQLIRGTIDHDIYHIGQIGVIRKLID